MKLVITGGAGLVGSTTADMLLERGDEVIAVDNFATGRRDNLAEHDRLTLVEGDIAEPETMQQVCADYRPDVIIHTAASYKDPDDWYNDTRTNCVGTANVVKAAQQNGVKRLIYFQTALSYGVKPTAQPVPLGYPLDPANSSYSISKTAAWQYIKYSGISAVTFILANVVGPRGVSGPLPIFYQRLSQGKKCFVTPARRDFVFSKDLARNVVKASAEGVGEGDYHFSSGKDVPIRELYDAMVEAMRLNDSPEPDLRPLGPDDAETILLDPTRTFADFGDIQFTPLSQIVDETVRYYEAYGVEGGYTHLKMNKENT